MVHSRKVSLCSLFIIGALAGCSHGPSALAPPRINPNAGQAAIEKYDANGDGSIDGDELKKVPALKTSMARADKNRDGKITAEEIDERIAAWKKSGLAIMRVTAVVRQNGQPLGDAAVTFVPEEFLGDVVKPATGVTDATGSAVMQISSAPDERGVQLGYYRIRISKKGANGQELIPSQYNAETESGVEVTPEDAGMDRVTIDIRPTK